MSKLLKLLALMALALAAGTSSAEQYHGFVKDPYYLVLGGKEVSPQDFVTDPLKYMRSPAAYTTLRDHVSQVVGRPVSDQDFRRLIVSDDVRVVTCVGRIKTDGITDSGKVGRHERDCYPKERLLEVKVMGGWMKLLSLGCYNPVEGERPPPPPPPKVVEVPPPPPPPPPKVVEAPPQPLVPECTWVRQRYIVPQFGQVIYVPGLSIEVCQGRVALPDVFVNLPSTVTTVVRYEQVCK